jgi:hypothetical protein
MFALFIIGPLQVNSMSAFMRDYAAVKRQNRQ